MKDPKDNLKPWKPGQSGNPAGVSKIEGQLRKNKNLTKKVLKNITDALLMGDQKTLNEMANTGKPLERWVAGIILEGIIKRDMQSLNTLLPWLIGKVKEEVTIEMAVPTIIKRFGSNEEIEYGSKLIGEEEDEEY